MRALLIDFGWISSSVIFRFQLVASSLPPLLPLLNLNLNLNRVKVESESENVGGGEEENALNGVVNECSNANVPAISVLNSIKTANPNDNNNDNDNNKEQGMEVKESTEMENEQPPPNKSLSSSSVFPSQDLVSLMASTPESRLERIHTELALLHSQYSASSLHPAFSLLSRILRNIVAFLLLLLLSSDPRPLLPHAPHAQPRQRFLPEALRPARARRRDLRAARLPRRRHRERPAPRPFRRAPRRRSAPTRSRRPPRRPHADSSRQSPAYAACWACGTCGGSERGVRPDEADATDDDEADGGGEDDGDAREGAGDADGAVRERGSGARLAGVPQ